MNDSQERRYILLVRHASRDTQAILGEAEQSMKDWTDNLDPVVPDYGKSGLPRTLAVANRLVDELGEVKVSAIWHSPHRVAEQTAQAFAWVMDRRARSAGPAELNWVLDPEEGSAAAMVDAFHDAAASGRFPAGTALVVVGHQPVLSTVAKALAPRLPAGTLPLGGSEVACLELDEDMKATLLWLLTVKSDALLADLKDKVKSKYDVAKFFLGAFVVNTGFVLSGVIWSVESLLAAVLVVVGFVLALVGLAFTAATLTSYDRLLMPNEFWTGGDGGGAKAGRWPRPRRWTVLRPPSQAQVVIFYEMVHVWTAFFLPALGCAFAALAAFLVALVYDSLVWPGLVLDTWWGAPLAVVLVVLVAAAALLVPLIVHYRPRRPELGFDD